MEQMEKTDVFNNLAVAISEGFTTRNLNFG